MEKLKIKLSEYRKLLKEFYSDCCKGRYVSKSNGLYTYYVCLECGKKTTAVNGKGKMLGIYGLFEKYKKQNHG